VEINMMRKIVLVLRYDDYSSRSKTDLEKDIINIINKYSISFSFGVIPFVTAGDCHNAERQDLVVLNKEKIDILKELIESENVEIAMHGYSHQATRYLSYNSYTEFSGLEYIDQLTRLKKGKNLLGELFGLSINTFIPPWNSYDINTLIALEEAGFKCISADNKSVIEHPTKLKCLPITCNINDVCYAIKLAKLSMDVNPVIVAILHEYDFKESNSSLSKITLSDFDELIKWVSLQKYIQTATISKAMESIEELNSKKLLSYSFVDRLSMSYLNKLYFYPSVSMLNRIKYLLLFVYGMILLGGLWLILKNILRAF
jgi:predicted deacetylase